MKKPREEIFNEVRKIVVKIIGVPADKVHEGAAFVEDLDAASLDLVELVMEIEKAFNIDIPEESIDQIVTVKDAVRFIEERLT